MTRGTLDDRYFEWLYSHVGSLKNRNPSRNYWHLTKQMYTTPFEWSVPNDDNRCEDGMNLRFEFLDELQIRDADPIWMGMQCSVLEMMIALADRACFESSGTPGDWFWHMVQNLNLRGYTDKVYSTTIQQEVTICLDRVVYRRYGANGSGGLFPLRKPRRDQRRVQLWDQLSAYMLESDFIDHGPH